MAPKLLIEQAGVRSPDAALRLADQTVGAPLKPMNRESQVRSVAVLLFILTVAAVVFAGFNFNAEWKFLVPDDGVWWVENGGRLTADRVDPNGPGAKSGIKPGDQLISINGQDIQTIATASGRKPHIPCSGSRFLSIRASFWFRRSGR